MNEEGRTYENNQDNPKRQPASRRSAANPREEVKSCFFHGFCWRGGRLMGLAAPAPFRRALPSTDFSDRALSGDHAEAVTGLWP